MLSSTNSNLAVDNELLCLLLDDDGISPVDSRSEAGYSDITDVTVTSQTVDELVNPLWIQDPDLRKKCRT